MFEVAELLKVTSGRLARGNKNATTGVISTDSRTIRNGQTFIAIKGDNFDGHDYIDAAIKKGAHCIIIGSQSHKVTKSQGVVVIEVKDTIKALGDIARFWRNKFDIPVVAVTGSNGKTTTKEMIAGLLSIKYKVLKNEGTKNNHIGVPLTLLNLDSSHGIAVLELGTNHFGEIAYLSGICRPNVGVVTNVGPSHLEYFRSLRGVLKEKYSLMKDLRHPCVGILNADDDLLKKEILKDNRRPSIISFGIKNKADFTASKIVLSKAGYRFVVNKKNKFMLRSLGRHNIYNALSALAVARIFGLSYAGAGDQLSAFKFPEGRFSEVTFKNIKFIDDTYNANPSSLKQALDSLATLEVKGRKIVVMGDMLELGSGKEAFHRSAGTHIGRICDVFISVGSLCELAAGSALSSGFDSKNIFACKSAQEARDILLNKVSVSSDDIVLVKGSRAMKMERIFL